MNNLFKGSVTMAMLIAISACNPGNDEKNEEQPIVDTTPPSLTDLPDAGTVLLANQNVSLSFSEPVNIDSFTLSQGGEIITNFTTAWNTENTQVTITPEPRWAGGKSSIVLEVADVAGNVLTSEPLDITVNLSFEIDAEAALVFGALESSGRSYYGNMFMDEDGIWVADCDEAQLHFYSSLPEQSNSEPDEVITAIDFTNTNTQEIEQFSFSCPQTPFVYNNQLFATDYSENAVYIFDGVPTSDSLNFGIILGHPSFEQESEGDFCSAERIDNAESVIAVDGRLLVADGDNSRVLIWNRIPTESGTLPDLVLGQPDFDTCEEGTSEFGLDYPSGVWSDGEKILVVDGNNHRVLGWNSFPSNNNQPADFVLGQEDFVSNECNQGLDAPTASTMCFSYEGITSNGRQIYLADTDNIRVLIWNDWPTENGVPADIVLGQPDFTTATVEDSEPDNRFENVVGVFAFDHYLLVSDESKGVITVFDGR